MNMRTDPPLTIAGSKGGKKGSSANGGTEAPNSLRSKQIARVVDLLGEGPIKGPHNGAASVFFDGVPLLSGNQYNFQNWAVAGNTGWPDQSVLRGFPAQQSETSVNIQLTTKATVVRTINDGNVDRVRITVSVPALQKTDKKNGNITGTFVEFDFYVQQNGGGWVYRGRFNISGKTNTRYQRAYTFDLPAGVGPWDLMLYRVTPDSAVIELQNELYWDSFTSIIDAKVNYTLSAVIGTTIDAEQFQTIPKRVYEIDGLYILLPNNYNPVTRVYTGVWDGTWQYNFSNNPAWVFFNLVHQPRYGLGNFIAIDQIDKWALYKIGQWCDQMVPNGKGGWEPRFVCNCVINEQQEAFDLVNALASVFRGQAYWAGGMMVPVADMPKDPVAQYTNANVIDGTFTYQGADIRARKNMALVKWNDPKNLGEPRIAIVEDTAGISKFGIQKTDVIAIGCTSESQAIRTGKWTLFSDTYESETVSFAAGLDTAWCRPGDVIRIADATIGGERRGGRIVEATADHVVLDAPVTVLATSGWVISCQMPDGHIETRNAASALGETVDIYPQPAFSAAPLPDSIWIHATSDLQPTLWRVVSARETEPDRFEVTALRQRPDKWAYIENNIALSNPDVSNIGTVPTITGLNAKDYLVALSPISVGVRMLVSWQSKAPAFDIAWRPVNGNWNRARIEQTAHDVDVEEGKYDVWVTPVNSMGRRGSTSKLVYTVVGKSAPPADVRNFRIQSVQGVAMFQWAPATDLDVLIGGGFEMRYSPRLSGVSWSSSNIVLTSIPGTATTVELPYRPGTYLIKARDIVGLYSKNFAVVTSSAPDINFRPYVRICEQTEWLGDKQNVRVQMPQEWLVLGVTGGTWDDQLTNMDTWPQVDELPIGPSGPAPNEGTYKFFNHIDMGGIVPVRLSVDMLAFPYIEDDVFVDERIGNTDDWQDWDNAAADAGGMVTIRMRQTDEDPANPGATWTEWQQFLSGEYTGRGFQFRADLGAPPGQNVAIEELCILADISNKQDQGADIPWVPNFMNIEFNLDFFSIPSISIAIQNGVVGDTFRITNKTRSGFKLELISSTGAIITGARTFDWIASGY